LEYQERKLLFKLEIITLRSALKSIARRDLQTQMSHTELERKFPLTFNWVSTGVHILSIAANK
jgi:hypothetical protein